MKNVLQAFLALGFIGRLVCAFMVLTAAIGFVALFFGFPAQFADRPLLLSGYIAALLLMLGFGVRGLRNR